MITISPGHYGKGTGASGIIDEGTETIKVARRVTAILREASITTNYIEDNVSRSQRENIPWLIAHHNKTSRQFDVSIHFNSSAGTSNNGLGTETLVYSNNNREVAKKITDAIANASGLKNRGVKIRTDLGLLRGTTRPCYLIEMCFVNDSVDVAIYRRDFEKICQAIAKELAAAVGKTIKNPVDEKESDEIMLTETGREEIRALLKKARGKGIISASVHTDKKIDSYTDIQLLSYQAAVINRTFN